MPEAGRTRVQEAASSVRSRHNSVKSRTSPKQGRMRCQMPERYRWQGVMQNIFEDVVTLIGNTPIVRLNRLRPETGADLYAKLEYMNPGSSVKDRIAVQMITDAEEQGLLKPGGTIVECTSGNTGMGLAMVGAVKGYRTILVMPDKVSGEKIKALRAFGARVI